MRFRPLVLALLVAACGDSTGTNNNTPVAAKLAFTAQPSSTAAGAAISPAVTVTVQDATGATVTTATDVVTIAIGTNPASGALGGTLTATAASGIATFANLTIDKAGDGYTLAATATGLTGATSTAFNVTPTAGAAEFTIAATTDEEVFGSVAYDGSNYLIGVQGRTSTTATSVGAQVVSGAGALVGQRVMVSGRTGDPVSIAFDGTNYLMAWGDHTAATTLAGQFVSKAGALVGSVFTISPDATVVGVESIAFGGGSYVVVYSKSVTGGSGNVTAKTFARTVSTGGAVGAEQAVSSGLTTPGGISGNLPFDGTNFFAVYTDEATIKGRFISPAGALGSEVTILTASGFRVENSVAVAYNGSSYLVALPHMVTGASKDDVYGQLVSGAGVPVGAAFSIATGDQFPIAVIASGTNFIVSYVDSLGTNGHQRMMARFVSGAGAVLGSPITIAVPSGGKAPLGGILAFNASKYFAVLFRGVSNPGSPDDPDSWTGKDIFGILLTLTTPGS